MLNGGDNSKSQVKDLTSLSVAYTSQGQYARFQERANKLVTALYMVTDIMDSTEPMRSKLRATGADFISDIYKNSHQTPKKISEILSFLGISYMMGMISEMNYNILKKEFSTILRSVTEVRGVSSFWSGGETALLDFLKEEEPVKRTSESFIGELGNKGQIKPARIGVQKAGTFMQALSDKISTMSVTNNSSHDVLKNKRREDIIEILKGQKDNNNSAGPKGLTITDIKGLASGVLATSGDKTVQRELVSMVKDGILKKTGEKRWSRYFLNPN